LLNISTEPLENCEVLMTVEVDEQQTEKLLKNAARRISRQIKIPGFRPGKAPYRLLVRRVGEEAVREEALEDLSQSVFKQALEQADLEPYAQASLEDVSWQPLVMKVRVPTAPVVELGDYRSLRLEPEAVEVTEDEVDQALEDLREQYAVWNPVERPAQLGDLITMSVEEHAGGQLLGQNDSLDYEMVPAEEGQAGPDLTSPLIGLSAGDEKEFPVVYPQTVEDPRYAGAEVTVSVTVHAVKEKELYPLDDDFAQTVGDFDTLEEFKDKLTEDIREQKERQADRKLADRALDRILETAERIEWPKVLEEEEIDHMLEDQDQQLQQQGLNLDTYLSMQKKTREELREEFRPAVQERLRRSLVMSELADAEQLSVAGHEVSDQIERLSTLAGERGQEMREELAKPDNIQHVLNDILTAKIRRRVVQIVKGEAETAEQETQPETETETQAETDAEPAVTDETQ
jgi:trigger factor